MKAGIPLSGAGITHKKVALSILSRGGQRGTTKH